MSKSGSKAQNLDKDDQEAYRYFCPSEWIVHRVQSKAGDSFKSEVYLSKGDADFIGRNEFMEEVVTEPSAYPFYDIPEEVSSSILNILEYFGLLIPYAKILIPFNQGGGHGDAIRGNKITSPLSWARWEHNSKNWMFRTNVKIIDGESHYLKDISGTILTQLDVDFWQSMRGLWPLQLEKYAKKSPNEYKRYQENPFDLHFPLIRNGNVFLDGQMVIPVFRKDDVPRCIQLLSFLDRPMPIELATLAWFERLKKSGIHKGKVSSSNKLRDEVWELLIDDFDNYKTKNNLKIDGLEGAGFNKYFYRNHYITAYVHAHVQRGSKVDKACEKAAAKLLYANEKGEEPLDPETIRKKIYYPTLPNLLSYNRLIVT